MSVAQVTESRVGDEATDPDPPGLFHLPYRAADRCREVADALTWCDGFDLHGERPSLVVSPGVVALRIPASRPRKSLHRLRHRTEDDVGERLAPDPLRPVTLDRTRPPQRGVVSSWSPKSRRRMVRTIAECVLDGHGWGMVTLTYPGDWLSCVPSPEVAKRQLKAFRKRWERKFGVQIECIWKLEFQRRGAPHFHLLIRIPSVALPIVRSWVLETWASIVGSGDPRHAKAGTSVDVKWRGWDGAAAIARYFGKHGLWSTKEYQHDVPDDWETSGRWWGVWNLDRVRESVSIDDLTAKQVRRLLRRWYRANHRRRMVVHGVELHNGVEVLRVGFKGGRLRSLDDGRAGAFVLCRDGPALAEQLGRALGLGEGGVSCAAFSPPVTVAASSASEIPIRMS